ncbi:hypothetical protein CsSME_00040021 [Camellia sinensis var. sinensis]
METPAKSRNCWGLDGDPVPLNKNYQTHRLDFDTILSFLFPFFFFFLVKFSRFGVGACWVGH